MTKAYHSRLVVRAILIGTVVSITRYELVWDMFNRCSQSGEIGKSVFVHRHLPLLISLHILSLRRRGG
jgi:hypothetical protein